MFHEHEQAVRVVQQLVLQTDEVGQVRRGLIWNDPFAVARAMHAEAGEQLGHLRRAADAQPGIALVTQRLVVRLAQLVEKRGVLGLTGVLQRELDRLADQVCPAQLMLREQALVGRVIVRHADPRERLAAARRRFGLGPRDAATIEHVHIVEKTHI